MTTQESSNSKWIKIKDKLPPIHTIILVVLAIILLVSLLFLIFYKSPKIYSLLFTKQVGYLLASLMLTLGLLGLSFDNTNLFQQEAFKLLVWSGVFIFILTFCFSITMDIIMVIKDKNNLATQIIK